MFDREGTTRRNLPNWGCIPTKTLLHGVEILETFRESKDYGIQAGEPSVDFGKLSTRKDRVVKTLVSGVAGLMKSNGIEGIKGLGRFVTPQKLEVSIKEFFKMGYR